MILGWIVEGSNALKAATLLRNVAVLRGKHMKCVFGRVVGFMVPIDVSLEPLIGEQIFETY